MTTVFTLMRHSEAIIARHCTKSNNALIVNVHQLIHTGWPLMQSLNVSLLLICWANRTDASDMRHCDGHVTSL